MLWKFRNSPAVLKNAFSARRLMKNGLSHVWSEKDRFVFIVYTSHRHTPFFSILIGTDRQAAHFLTVQGIEIGREVADVCTDDVSFFLCCLKGVPNFPVFLSLPSIWQRHMDDWQRLFSTRLYSSANIWNILQMTRFSPEKFTLFFFQDDLQGILTV